MEVVYVAQMGIDEVQEFVVRIDEYHAELLALCVELERLDLGREFLL